MPSAPGPHAVRRSRIALMVATTAALAASLSGCDSSPGSAPVAGGTDPRQITVIGTGQVQGTPDTLTVNVSMEATAADVTSALNQTSERQQAVVKAIRDAGIDEKDISTTDVSVQPQYSPDSAHISGYQAGNTITVKIRKTDTASPVLAQIATTGGDATRINSINYSIEDDSQLVKDARARAFEDAKDRAAQYAQLSGQSLGKVIAISEATGDSAPPSTHMPRAALAAPVPLEPGQQTVGFSVKVIWELT